METLGFNSPSLNPENVLPQWQQKIAYAENKEGRCSDQALDPFIFCTKCNFLQVLDLLQKQPGDWAEVVCIFTFFYMPNGNGNKKMPQLSSENCGWLPHRDSNSVKQNQNLVCYHYTMGQIYLPGVWWLTKAVPLHHGAIEFFCVFAGAKIRDYSDISKFFGKNLSH